MTIEQKILSKLAPHAKRIKDGDGNDFDYLPAVLLQVLEEQKRQSQTLDDVKKSLAAMDNKSDGLARKLHQLEAIIERKMEEHGKTIREIQSQLNNLQNSLSRQIGELSDKHGEHATHTDVKLTAIASNLDSFIISTKLTDVNVSRWLILGFTASLLIIGLAVTILQGH